MLIAVSADLSAVLSRLLFYCSVACCGLLLASFALFAHDQASKGSKHQVSALDARHSAIAGGPAPRDAAQPRRFIDGAARTLTSPLRSLVTGDSQWAVRLTTTALGLLVYGLGLGLVSRLIRLGRLRA